MAKHVFSVWLLFAIGAAVSQEPPPKKAVASEKLLRARIYFREEGGSLSVSILESELTMDTKYGKLTIPFSEIRQIDVGLRCMPEIKKAVGLLGSNQFADRDAAAKYLEKAGPAAYPFVKKLLGSSDLEQAKRAAIILERIKDRHSLDAATQREDDVVLAREFTAKGRILNHECKVRCAHIQPDPFTVKLCDIVTMVANLNDQEQCLIVEAGKTDPAAEKWTSAGSIVRQSDRLVIRADGQVDLWPVGPGQYVVGPKGYSTAGKGGIYMAGVLLAKIGEKGKVFVVGEHYDATAQEEGKLFFAIVRSSWVNASEGSYRVRFSLKQKMFQPPAIIID